MDPSSLLHRVWLCYRFCESLPYPMLIAEAESGTIRYANQRFQEQILPEASAESDRPIWEHGPGIVSEEQWRQLLEDLDETGSCSYPSGLPASEGTTHHLMVHAQRYREQEQSFVFVLFGPPPAGGTYSPEASRDELTNLHTRGVIHQFLEQTLQEQSRSDRPFALLFVDFDGFKRINDQYGHPAGDEVLRRTASRIQDAIRPGDGAARYGGDEFLLLIRDLKASEETASVVERIVEQLESPIDVEGARIPVSVSVGVRIVEDPESPPQQLIRQADEAMYAAKSDPDRRIRYFDENLGETVRRRIRLREAFPQALASGQFSLWGQPIVELESGREVGAEWLLRWNRNGDKPREAGSFLPIFEETRQMIELDRWVLEHLPSISQHEGDGAESQARPLPLRSVNLSRFSIVREKLVQRMEPFAGDPSMRTFQPIVDVPASLFREEPPEVLEEIVRSLAADTLSIAVDGVDVRTPLLALETEEIGFVKIHRSVVQHLEAPSKRRFLRRLMRYVSDNALQVVGVGIETEEQFHTLRALGCDYGQGYYFGRPKPLERD